MKRSLLILAVCAAGFIPSIILGAPRDAPKKLVIAYIMEPDTLDATSSRLSMVSGPVFENMTERLVGLTPDGKLVPGLASWKVSPDGKVIDFTLRKGIKFHSGDPLTSKDVEFSHNRMLKLAPAYEGIARLIEKLEIISDSQFRIHFKKPDVSFLPMRGPDIASKNYYDRVGEAEFLNRPVGTGPYKFVNWKHGEYVDLEASEDYWGGPPSVKQLRFVFVKEDMTRISMLKTGEADMIMECPFNLVDNIESAGFKTAKLPVHGGISVQFHTKNPKAPWFDRRVRLAIAQAIDGDSVVKNLFHGIPARYAAVAPWELGYDPSLKPYPYDPKRAKELLAESGYPKGFQMPLYYFAGRATGIKETAEAVVLYLKAVGIECNVQGIESVQLRAKIAAWRNDPNAEFVGVSTVPAAHYPEPTSGMEMGFWSGSYGSVYSNPEFDAVLEKCRVTMDDTQRAELFKKAIRILYEDVARIPIWANMSVFAMKKNIEFTPTKGMFYAIVLGKDVKIRD
jgi:peptide/nickel transport system substrate-binding protein